ncbi:BTAD domain-containing putative transcriptional regulator [Amycolatopsis sp. Poz14]|uniref:AfsR/SARP family transcriptional regulator n=1 Tax=Amycolatopsis sp. Poz14 TaxID=1447705 RepID=UPI001EE8C405|nr:BTAD domain-containing putative transcriptional regulator [Amycolatopsis sp. Poz14]MCG3753595.1 AfsR/SARP family transcriptional regulator [Amycolatopsis sp. Poz14]
MRFGVLGPLAVWDDAGEPVAVPEAKVRRLLAVLLASDGGPVSADRLLYDLWGTELPGKPLGALQAKVSQLRRVVGRDRLERQPAGYRLRIEHSEDLDARRFRVLVAKARSTPDPRSRAALLTEALELWRGAAYADFADEDFARADAHRLTEQRLTAAEERAKAWLETGEHAAAVDELGVLVPQHPLRESLRAVQMRALYLSGRQGDALASYAELRERLAEELGVDPGRELRALHEAMLRQDPGLAAGPLPHGNLLSPLAATAPQLHGNLPTGLAATAPQLHGNPPTPHAAAGPLPHGDLPTGLAATAPLPHGDLPTGLASAAPQPHGNPPTPLAATAPQPHSNPPNALTPHAAAPRPHSNLPSALTPLAAAPRPHSNLPSALTPLAAAPRPHSNLPSALTPLIGREQALTQLSGLLGTTRLVTLTGPGGVGKSRLAVAAAAEAAAEFPDGVRLVEFAGVRDGTADDLAEVAAAAFGIRDGSSATPPSTGAAAPTRRLAAALRDRRALLVLDNCEHVVDAAAELTELLLHSAPGLRILATSQEPLGLPGEGVFAVEPLPTTEAVRLFVERAAASAPGFPRQPEDCAPADLEAVTEICRRLDGIPLALELAATRVRGLGVRELATRLSDRFSILTRGKRGAPARQQTLRAVIDWSWELLSAPERIVLRRLAIHRDGCDLEAAEAVCAGDGVRHEEVLDLVTRLVDRSLVVVANGPAGIRYRLLESVAAYTAERLHETSDAAETRIRHLRHYLALAERAEPRLRGDEQRTWLTRLDAEAGNMRAALDEAVRASATEEAVRLATALSWWWLLRGRLAEGRRALSTVLDAVSPDAELAVLHHAFALLTGDQAAAPADAAAIRDPIRRGRALWLRAYSLFSVGDATASAETNALALDLFTAEDDQWGVAAALGLRAMLALVRGDLAGLGRDGVRSAALFRALGDRWGEMQTIPPLAALAEIKGDYQDAADRQRAGLAIARELDLQAEVSARLSGLGRLALLERDWERARDLHRQAHRIAVEHGYTYGQIHAEMGLALGARRSGDLDTAEKHLHHIRDSYAGLSSLAGDHLLYAELGFVAELRGDAGQATAFHLRSLDTARTLDEPRALALSLEGLAGAAARKGTAECAALLLGAADAARRRVDAPLPRAERGDTDRITAAAQAALSESGFAEAFQRGAGLSVEAAIVEGTAECANSARMRNCPAG